MGGTTSTTDGSSMGGSTTTGATGNVGGNSSGMGGTTSVGGTTGGAGVGGTGGAGATGGLIMKCAEGDDFCECDSLGCFVAVGGPCVEAGDCKTQECGVTQMQENVCCALHCEADQVCSADGATCEKADPCPEDEDRCFEDYQVCVDGDWVTDSECEGRGCDLALGGCKLDAGDTCASDNECGVGTCQDTASGGKVCCASTCGPCQMCNDEGNGCATPSTVPDGCECTPTDTSQCQDEHSCTDDICVDESCQNPVAEGCLIDGECISQGTREPGNPCRQCNSSVNDTGWSNVSNGTACDDGLWCNGDNDVCDGVGNCAHTYPTGNRCAGTTGVCELQTCSESKKNCYKAAGQVCDEETWNGCLQGSACSSDVYEWPVRYTCSGSSANCGTTPNEIHAEATVTDNCGSTEACHAASGTCRETLGCGTTYCKAGLCWTKSNATDQYAQEPARVYCRDLAFAGRDDWRLPTVAEFDTLVEGPTGGCYWATEMGACDTELWSTDDSLSFAPWVGTNALQISSVPLYVRCVITP